MIVSLDLVTAQHLGLPRSIHKSTYDTQLPRNLAEEDLHEDMTELPPPRPDTESTGTCTGDGGRSTRPVAGCCEAW